MLEAGCGAGRFTEILLQLPAAAVTSTDLNSAVEPNQVNCPQSARHRIVQCDIKDLQFPPAQYDMVICLGVLQHTRPKYSCPCCRQGVQIAPTPLTLFWGRSTWKRSAPDVLFGMFGGKVPMRPR